MKKLTIAIPTYNRAKELKKTLLNLFETDCFEDIYVYISDNCSEDNTAEVVNEFISARNLDNVKYNLSKQNLGFDGNVLKCYEVCETEYIWILSDDDAIIPNAIVTLLNILDSSHVMCLNDLLDNGELGLNATESVIDLSENTRWEAISKFVWISRFVVKKENLNYEILNQFLGTGLIH